MALAMRSNAMPDSLLPGSPTAPRLQEDSSDKGESEPRSLRFWVIIAALSLLAFICALDATIITTPLPTIVEDIGGKTQYIWIANSFVVAATVLQPLFGQLANILGRKILILACLILFMLGSGLAGGSRNPGMFIAGRTIQGAGAGGIYVLIDIICCDLVALRHRGKYLGIVNAWAGVASGLGPVLGGAFGRGSWPWIFYINLPICAVPLVTLFFVMEMNTGVADAKGATRLRKLGELDVLGNIIFIPSMISLLFGLVTGGIQYPWSSWRIILPLVLGVVGWAAFHFQQHFATNPMVPERLFSNRTSTAAYILTFLTSVVAQTTLYFIPVYLQSIVGANVLLAGVYFLPTALGILIAAAVAGVILSRTGAYKPLHWIAFASSSLGFGLFTTLDTHTPTVAWVFYQLFAAAGSGIPISTLLPAIMAALSESDVAASTSIFSFIKTFGYIWGVTIPSVIFNAVFNNNLFRIGDPKIAEQLKDGGAYAYASHVHATRQLRGAQTFNEIAHIYVLSLRAIWWLGLALSLLGVLIVFIEKRLELRTELHTEFGLNEQAKELGTKES
ncbi:MFS general substrate transporter [Xylaria sp. FL0933]|nr:MFS general substrate transporter [Xylaria sp. FL0933]